MFPILPQKAAVMKLLTRAGRYSQTGFRTETSLRHMVYHVKVGDIIYVKQGPYIVGKGRVRAAYKYDPTILKGAIEEWEHYLTVDWEKDFPKFRCVLGADIWPVLPLKDARLKQVLAAEAQARNTA